ncbi:hypothetical protein D9M69_702400 [compost metagenome]
MVLCEIQRIHVVCCFVVRVLYDFYLDVFYVLAILFYRRAFVADYDNNFTKSSFDVGIDLILKDRLSGGGYKAFGFGVCHWAKARANSSGKYYSNHFLVLVRMFWLEWLDRRGES